MSSAPPPPVVRSLAAAVEHILGLAPGDGSAWVVGLTGPVGSGKSTLATRLSEGRAAAIISTDDYLPDYDRTPEGERDLPESSDLGLLCGHLTELRAGSPAEIPRWSFQEHRRTGSRTQSPAPLIVVEGLHALAEPVRPSVDLAVYVEAARSTRWDRWEAIERKGERGMGVEAARAFFDRVAEPTFARFAAGYRAEADLVVVNEP